MDKSFERRLKDARDLRGMNQSQLAEKSGLPVTSISHFEAGSRKPSFDNLKTLAKALDVSADFLLGLTDTPTKEYTSDPLYRHGQNLTTKDRKVAERILQLLAEQDWKGKE